MRGPNVMRGYLGKPEETARTLRGGWLHSGDVGRFDDDGYLVLVDRLKDMIIRGGENIYPKEIEDALYAHPSVAEAAVVGRPDPLFGEEPVAFVALRPGLAAEPDELIEHCKTRWQSSRLPRAVFIETDLPKTPIGKIAKPALETASHPPPRKRLMPPPRQCWSVYVPRVDLDTYTPPAPALIAHRNSSSVAMRTATQLHLTTERTGSRPTARQRRVPHRQALRKSRDGPAPVCVTPLPARFAANGSGSVIVDVVNDPTSGSRSRADPHPMRLHAWIPGLELEILEPLDLRRVGYFLGFANDDHAPPGLINGIGAVDLKRRGS